MTTRVQPDWKVTTGYRVLLHVGWIIISSAVSLVAAAAVFDLSGTWWMVAGLAAGVLGLVTMLPEPVPRDQLVARRNRIDPRRIG
jgi:hypothetical protein